jgi:hypothetical protein
MDLSCTYVRRNMSIVGETISGLWAYPFYLSGIPRESFRVIVNAQELGFESTETPRTDRSVSLLSCGSW